MSFFLKKKQKPNSNVQHNDKKTKKKKVWRFIIIALASILVVFIAYVAFLVASGSKVFEQGLSGQSLIKTLYGGEKLKGEEQNRINILVMGMGGANHPGGLLTDSMMVISIRPSDKKIAILSIPRDLQVKVAGIGDAKINSAFSAGYNDYYSKQCNKKNATSCGELAMSAGAKQSADTVASTLAIPIHYYITADFKGFEKIIDQLGGIDVFVDKAIDDPAFPADDMVHYSRFKIKAGQQHLDGKTALKYARSRETTSDFDRASRQQKIISALKDKATTAGFLANPKKIADVVSTLGNSIRTSFTLSEMKSFTELLSGVSMNGAVTDVLSNGPNGLLVDYNNGTYYLKPKTGNFKEIQKFVANIFDPAQTPENPRVEILNGTTTSGLGSIMAKEIEKLDGYQIISIKTSTEKSAKTIIYDYSGGKNKNSLAELTAKYKASVVTKTNPGSNIDFSILIGDDYKKSSSNL